MVQREPPHQRTDRPRDPAPADIAGALSRPRPAASGQRPAASGQRPAASGQRPAASGQRPAASGIEPQSRQGRKDTDRPSASGLKSRFAVNCGAQDDPASSLEAGSWKPFFSSRPLRLCGSTRWRLVAGS
ncbi:hypothetical protein EBL85_01845 [Marichromatium sp. AB32]|nr:hypothetical protein EBL85_01845 [Marichromatium sp. AB32]